MDPTRASTLCLVLAALASTGCYRAHEREVGATLDAGALVDRGLPAMDAFRGRDARPDPRVDVGILPIEPEPDGAVDLPPDAWLADGATPSSVVLTLEGDPVIADDDMSPGAGGGIPFLEWDGRGWGLLWMNEDQRLRLLDQDGVPLAPSVLVQAHTWPGGGSLDFAIGRYAVVVASGEGSALRLYDRNLRRVPATAPLVNTHSTDVARLDARHQWIVAARSYDNPRLVVISTYDDALRPVDDPLTLGFEAIAETSDLVRVAALKTRAVVIYDTPAGPEARVFTSEPLAQLGDPIALGPGGRGERAGEIEPMGDRFVITTGAAGAGAQAYVLDPWTGAVEGPFAVESRLLYNDARPAPVPEHGMFAVCWTFGRDSRGVPVEASNSVGIQVLALDGHPLSAPLVVATGLRNAAAVACGWNGSEFVVAWWRASGDNNLFTQRVHAEL